MEYCFDESLSPRIGELLAAVEYPIVLAPKGTKDEDLIPNMGRKQLAWVTKDHRAKTQHEPALRSAAISVIWVRGLTHARKKKGPIQKTVRLKDILRMLVNKLDDITRILESSRTPRYFILYMTISGKTEYESYASIWEVHDRLAGVSS